MFPKAPATVIGPGIRACRDCRQDEQPTASLGQSMEQQEIRTKKSDIHHAKESTTEEQERIINPLIEIKNIKREEKKRQKQAASDSLGGEIAGA